MSSEKPAHKTTTSPATPSPSVAFLLRTLLACYYPFLAFVVSLMGAAIAGLGVASYFHPHYSPALALPALLLLLTLLQLLWALRVVFTKIKDFDDTMELRVPREMAPQLYDWVESIAVERGLPMPDDIRVAADTIAHIYERVNGQNVLVFGGVAVQAVPQPVLAGIVAHELGHLGAGDTSLGRRALRRHLVMGQVEFTFQAKRGLLQHQRGGFHSLARLGVVLNPGVWAVRLYHLLYGLVHAAHSRQREYAADHLSVERSGAEVAAQVLILMTVAERMPWTRLSSLAESWVELNESAHLLFKEQARAARSISPSEWRDAIRKEMKKSAGVFDSHPGLKQRLAAMGVSPKRAAQLTPQLSGTPADELFGEWWPRLEKQLAERLLALYREAYAARREFGDTITALRKLGERSRS